LYREKSIFFKEVKMPRGNGTGPAGMGPMTGRAAGYCAGYPVAGCMNRGIGMGMGRGRGRGFARMRWGAYPAYSGTAAGYEAIPETGSAPGELEVLRQQAEHLSRSLESITGRIEQLESKKTDGGKR